MHPSTFSLLFWLFAHYEHHVSQSGTLINEKNSTSTPQIFASSIFRELKDYTIVILFFLLWGNSLTFLFKNNKRFYARHTVGKSASWKAHYRLSCPLPVILYQTFFSSDIAPLLLKQNSSPVWSILEMFSYFQGTKSQVCLQFSYCPFKDALLLKWRWICWAITRNVSACLWNVCVWSSIYLYVYL